MSTEDSPENPIEIGGKGGYDRLSDIMWTCNSNAIFRRFAKLSIENLLYLQADLVRLENKLREVQEKDRKSGHHHRELYSMDWELILLSEKRSRRDGDGNSTKQLETILEIRERLNQYQEALLLYYKTFELRRPHQSVLTDLQRWMDSKYAGNVWLIGRDRHTWSDPDTLADLLVLHKPSSQADPFNQWVTNHLSNLYHSTIGKRLHEGIMETRIGLGETIIYSSRNIQRITRSFTIMVACMLPITTTVILYVVEDTPKRLGIIASFTALFSLALGFFTRATLAEIFSATAAFAAVCVVWVGTTSNNLIAPTSPSSI